jgi:hypothetical protein
MSQQEAYGFAAGRPGAAGVGIRGVPSGMNVGGKEPEAAEGMGSS